MTEVRLPIPESAVAPTQLKTPSPYRVELYQPGNWDTVRKEVMNVETSSFAPEHAFSSRLLKDMFETPHSTAVLLRDGEQIVGYTIGVPIGYEYPKRTGESRDTAFVESTAILEKYRGQKDGDQKLISKLLSTLDEELRQKGFLYIERNAEINNGYAERLMNFYGDRVVDAKEEYTKYGHKMTMRIRLYPKDQMPYEKPAPLISRSPLKWINRALDLRKPAEIDGQMTNWQDLYQHVEPGNNMMELSENVLAAVEKFIAPKVADLQQSIATLRNLDPKHIQEAIAKNYFEELVTQKTDDKGNSVEGEAITGQRREVLLSVFAHVVRRMETHAYKEIFQRMDETQLGSFGLNTDTRNLLVDLLDVTEKADPLYIRFMAYAQKVGAIPDRTAPMSFILPGHNRRFTFAELFPKESTSIARGLLETSGATPEEIEAIIPTNLENVRRFGDEVGITKEELESAQSRGDEFGPEKKLNLYTGEISDEMITDDELQTTAPEQVTNQYNTTTYAEVFTQPGGETLKTYLQTLAKLYVEKDIQKSLRYQKRIEGLYKQLLINSFPILLTPQIIGEGYAKPPYPDFELKTSLRTPDAKPQEEHLRQVNQALANATHALGMEQFTPAIEKQSISVVDAVGQFGAGLTFSTVAQEVHGIAVFRNIQERAYDREFESLLSLLGNTETVFGSQDEELIKQMPGDFTVLHEGSHHIFPDGSQEANRLGKDAIVVIDEVKAETLYRTLIPDMIKNGELQGTPEQWAIGMVTNSFQLIKDTSSDDPYYQAAVFTLNDVFLSKNNVVHIENGRFMITDFDKFYAVMKNNAEEILDLYRNPDMNPELAEKWIKSRCKSNQELKEAIKILDQIS